MTTCSFRMVRGPGVRADCTLIGRYFDGLIHSSPALHVFRQQRKHKIAPDAAIGVFFSPRFDSCFGLTDSLSFFFFVVMFPFCLSHVFPCFSLPLFCMLS